MRTRTAGRASAAPASEASRFVDAGGLRTHYLDFPGADPAIVLLHGLSANAHEFGGLIAAGLSPTFRIVAPDLRGRGRTDTPPSGYAMRDHARDVLALLDALGIERAVLGGHSFGAFLAIYLAAHHPDRFDKLVVIDAATRLNPYVRDLLQPSLERLTRVRPSASAYLAELRAAPYLDGMWDGAVEGYFRAEIAEQPDGTARSSTSAVAIAQTLDAVGAESWDELIARVRVPALLFNALGPYGPPGAPPLIDPGHARETAHLLPDGRYVPVPGNHLTMVFGDGAGVIAREITAFVRGDA